MPATMKRFDSLGRRDLRLISGLVLFTYLSVHLINHSLGLISLDVAEAGLRRVVAFWHSAPGTVLLYGAAATHVVLALLAVYERRTLRMPALQALRIVLGLWMPVVLITHFTGTRIAFDRYHLPSDYAQIVAALWTPEGQGRQLALLVPGWIHGCLGLKFAFGGKPWFRRALPVLFGASLMLPVLAGLGFLTMGRELAQAQAAAPPGSATPNLRDHQPELVLVRDKLLAFYCGAIALVLVARQVRWVVERQRKALVTIEYPGRKVQVPRGWTVLEASRSFDIAHLSLCGGNARCSTCRVRIVSGADHCAPPSAAEQQLLSRMHAGDDVRLACQLRPRGDIAVEPLFAAVRKSLGRAERPQPTTEHTVAIVVADLRSSAMSTSSNRSAHDTAYVLNLFYDAFGDAVIAGSGTLCGHAGHEAIAIFGLEVPLRMACTQTLEALAQVEGAVQHLNARLATGLGGACELVLAAHVGAVVVGQLGYRDATTLTAVGPAVDATRRLRDHAQRHGFGCVISQALLDASRAARTAMAWRDADLDEHGNPIRVCAGTSSGACLADVAPGAPASSR